MLLMASLQAARVMFELIFRCPKLSDGIIWILMSHLIVFLPSLCGRRRRIILILNYTIWFPIFFLYILNCDWLCSCHTFADCAWFHKLGNNASIFISIFRFWIRKFSITRITAKVQTIKELPLLSETPMLKREVQQWSALLPYLHVFNSSDFSLIFSRRKVSI